MSKRANDLIATLHRRLKSIWRTVDDMQGNVEFMNKESEPEAYRRWYLSYHEVQNLEGEVTDALEKLKAYDAYKKLPWWKRLLKRGF